jgi:molybdate transport system regulatory protein
VNGKNIVGQRDSGEHPAPRGLKGVVKVKVKGENIFWGSGMMELLELIKKCGSLKQACEQMQMSYSKGYRIIKAAEAELGFPILYREKGGLQGGGSVLTPEGEKFADCYQSYLLEMRGLSEKAFSRCFEKYLK